MEKPAPIGKEGGEVGLDTIVQRDAGGEYKEQYRLNGRQSPTALLQTSTDIECQ